MIQPSLNSHIDLSEPTFLQFLEQLKKDFESAGLDSQFCQGLTPDYVSVVEAVKKELALVSSSSVEKLTNLLYRVDVQERDTKVWLETYKISFAEALAHLIVRRELQKIWFKRKFSKK